MKREDLKALGLTDETQIDAIMAAHGRDVEKFKASVDTAKAETDGLKAQLTEANTQIESFKGMDVEGVRKSADDWKAKAEQAEKDRDAGILKVKQERALDRDLEKKYSVKDLIAVKAHLKSDDLKYVEKDDAFIGLEEQIKPIKEGYSNYFSDTKPAPQIVTGGNNQSVITDAMVEAARQGAKLPAAKTS